MIDIVEKLINLAQERVNLSIQKHNVELSQKELEDTEAWQDWKKENEFLRAREEIVDTLEKEIREIAIEEYNRKDNKDNKTIIQGVVVKEFSIIKVLDEKKALIWASQNAPSILKLDQTKFKKAVENLELDFVEKGVEYRGQIASDLSEYLK